MIIKWVEVVNRLITKSTQSYVQVAIKTTHNNWILFAFHAVSVTYSLSRNESVEQAPSQCCPAFIECSGLVQTILLWQLSDALQSWISTTAACRMSAKLHLTGTKNYTYLITWRTHFFIFKPVKSKTDMHTPVWVKNNGSSKDGDDKYLVPKKEWINFLNFEDLFNTKLLTHKGMQKLVLKLSSFCKQM